MRFHTLKELDSSHGTVLLHNASAPEELILHPEPNPNDPNDPLRWPKWKKYVCFTSVCAFAFLTNYAIGGLAPAFYILSIQFNKTQSEISGLLEWPILVLGAANFIWVPIANYYGKRPVFVFATLLLCLCYLWGALAQSFESLLWSNIIAAFAGSASEAVAAGTVNDLFFLHERANLMGWYMNAISGGNTIGPLLCGFIVTGSSWRTQKWLAFALVALNFLAVLFFCPETRYQRHSWNTPATTQASTSATTPSPEHFNIAKTDPVSSTAPSRLAFKELRMESEDSCVEIPRKTFRQELALWSGTPADTNLFAMFLRPLPLIVYPAVIFSFLGFAVSLAWVVAINILNSFILQAPPYNWKPSINGLINIPGLLGNLFGAFIGGWVVDRYSDWRSRKNGGVFQSETRLHLLFIPAILVAVGCLAFGYGVEKSLNWTALFFGNGLVGVGLTAFPTMTMTYLSDAYLPINEDVLTLVIGLKNIVCFGFLYAILPWVDTAGYVNAFGTQAGIYVAVSLLAVPLIVYGERIRNATAGWRIILF